MRFVHPSENKYDRPPYSRTNIFRAPHVARQQQLSMDICCPRPTSAANPPAAAAAVDWRDTQTDGRTDGLFRNVYSTLCGPRITSSISHFFFCVPYCPLFGTDIYGAREKTPRMFLTVRSHVETFREKNKIKLTRRSHVKLHVRT